MAGHRAGTAVVYAAPVGSFLRLLLLVFLLNGIRYVVGGAIEAGTIMEPMHRVMPQYPEVFDNQFSSTDFAVSLGYNFSMWFAVALAFHLMHPSLPGGWMRKSLLGYGVMCLFFVSLAAVYMNHYTDPIKPFYAWSMVDALIVFTVVGVANGLLYPRIMGRGQQAVQP
jgi:hypothetical protein